MAREYIGAVGPLGGIPARARSAFRAASALQSSLQPGSDAGRLADGYRILSELEPKLMPTNPITDGTERAVIENALDRNREALIETARGLSDADARRRLVTSLTTPISLIKHAAAAERIWFQRFWAGLDADQCDGYAERDEGTFAVSDDEPLADVIAEFERAGRLSRDIASGFHLDDTVDIPGEGRISMRWTLLAMVEEFARHAGHGDILREQIDATARDSWDR
jgi:hypothetical protein